MEFKELGLSEATISAIEEMNIKHPTTVQADVIPSVLEGKDIFTIAPQRSGKTYSYVLPLIDIIATKKNQNILIITPDSFQANNVSDSFAVFNKYHQNNEEDESSVVIAAPDLILELADEDKLDLSNINILVVDDINLIKKRHQLQNLEKILVKLPADKQNIVFTNRRSKETQNILDEILKTPTEIKIDKTKEDEAVAIQEHLAEQTHQKTSAGPIQQVQDEKALELVKKYHVFNDKTPKYLLVEGVLKN